METATATKPNRVAAMLGGEALTRLHAGIEHGSALPNVAYTSDEWLELERRHLMWPLWMLAGHALSALRLARTLVRAFKSNWKPVFGNDFDNDHIFAIYPRLDAFSPMVSRRGFEIEETLLHTDVTFGEPEEGRAVGLPCDPGLAPELERFEAGGHLFPGCCCQIWPDRLTAFQVFPVASDHTIEHLHVFPTTPGGAVIDPAPETGRQGVDAMRGERNREDIGAIAWMHKGRQSPAFGSGVLSGWRDPPHRRFARMVVETMA